MNIRLAGVLPLHPQLKAESVRVPVAAGAAVRGIFEEFIMKFWKKLIVVACLFALLIPAVGCQEEGAAEKAGKKIDQAADDAKDAAKKLFE